MMLKLKKKLLKRLYYCKTIQELLKHNMLMKLQLGDGLISTQIKYNELSITKI